MQQTLRRAGGSLVMTVPKAFIEQNQLKEGSQVELFVEGDQMKITAPRKPQYDLKTLLDEMPDGLPMVEGWDAMPAVGKEAL
jgi:antitoxin ChpS